MKVILVGATGTIGREIYSVIAENHEVIQASRKGPDIKVDITIPKSIEAMFEECVDFDALICAAGEAYVGSLESTTEAHFLEGLHNKLQGQVNLVLLGQLYIKEGGSFTLTSGISSEKPVLKSANLSVIDAGIDAFVKAAALELIEKNVRINAVSPGWLNASSDTMGELRSGQPTVSLGEVVPAYIKSLEGEETGQIYRVF
jgi:NAD(P)-dependent dehydrogenase (short-subunit alcohol dehydrogenase family)